MNNPMDAYVLSRTLLLGTSGNRPQRNHHRHQQHFTKPSAPHAHGHIQQQVTHHHQHHHQLPSLPPPPPSSVVVKAAPVVVVATIADADARTPAPSVLSDTAPLSPASSSSSSDDDDMDYPMSPAPGGVLNINAQQSHDNWLALAGTPSATGHTLVSPLQGQPASPMSSLLAPMITPLSPLPMSPSPYGNGTDTAASLGFRYANQATLPMTATPVMASNAYAATAASMANPHTTMAAAITAAGHAHATHTHAHNGHGHHHAHTATAATVATPVTPVTPTVDSVGDDDANGDNRKRRFVRMAAGAACVVCHAQKTKCDGRRPCGRCTRLQREDRCVDRQLDASAPVARNSRAAAAPRGKKAAAAAVAVTPTAPSATAAAIAAAAVAAATHTYTTPQSPYPATPVAPSPRSGVEPRSKRARRTPAGSPLPPVPPMTATTAADDSSHHNTTPDHNGDTAAAVLASFGNSAAAAQQQQAQSRPPSALPSPSASSSSASATVTHSAIMSSTPGLTPPPDAIAATHIHVTAPPPHRGPTQSHSMVTHAPPPPPPPQQQQQMVLPPEPRIVSDMCGFPTRGGPMDKEDGTDGLYHRAMLELGPWFREQMEEAIESQRTSANVVHHSCMRLSWMLGKPFLASLADSPLLAAIPSLAKAIKMAAEDKDEDTVDVPTTPGSKASVPSLFAPGTGLRSLSPIAPSGTVLFIQKEVVFVRNEPLDDLPVAILSVTRDQSLPLPPFPLPANAFQASAHPLSPSFIAATANNGSATSVPPMNAPPGTSASSSGNGSKDGKESKDAAQAAGGPYKLRLQYSINREYERLLGHSQRDVELRMQSLGFKGLWALTDYEEAKTMAQLIFRCTLGVDRDFRMLAGITNKWGCALRVLISGRFDMDLEHNFRSASFCLTPMPLTAR